MKLAFFKVPNIQKFSKKQFQAVIKKGSMQTPCSFEGSKLQLGQRWLSFGSYGSKICSRPFSYSLLIGIHSIDHLWAIPGHLLAPEKNSEELICFLPPCSNTVTGSILSGAIFSVPLFPSYSKTTNFII